MKYIIDSSVAFKWVVREADTDKALSMRDNYRNAIHDLLAPDVFPAEIAHGLTKASRQRRIALAQARALWRTVMLDAPALHRSVPVMERAIDIATQFYVPVYDCIYVALAEREQCELVTADDKLTKNLQPHFPFIKSLASFP